MFFGSGHPFGLMTYEFGLPRARGVSLGGQEGGF